MPVEPLVPLREEELAARLAPVEGGGAGDHLPLDPTRRHFQVVRHLGVCPAVVADDIGTIAVGALPASDLDLSVWPELLGLLPPGDDTGPSDGLAGAEI